MSGATAGTQATRHRDLNFLADRSRHSSAGSHATAMQLVDMRGSRKGADVATYAIRDLQLYDANPCLLGPAGPSHAGRSPQHGAHAAVGEVERHGPRAATVDD